MPDGTVSGQGALARNIALPWFEAGCSVVPIQANGTKRPTRDWSVLQTTPMTRAEVDWYWRPGESSGVALICGAVSGNLEMTEMEADASSKESLDKIAEECDQRGIKDLWDSLLIEGYAECTPSGGIHLIYRVEDHEVPGNTKLASTPTGKTLAETRGEGGYVIVAPTNGACHSSGKPWETVGGQQGKIRTITWSQRMTIHSAISAALDESPPPPPITPRREIAVRTNEDELRPGDDFDLRASWHDSWFTNTGWKVSHQMGGEIFWVRPGKDARDGHSASTGYNGQADRLYIWSTSTGLPSEQPLTKFFVYAHYHHNSDLSAAAAALRRQGYGGGSNSVSALSPLRELVFDLAQGIDGEVSLPAHGGSDLTDTGNGRRMKELFGSRFRFSPKEKKWYLWTGSAWEVDNLQEIQRAAEYAAELVLDMAKNELSASLGTDFEKEARKKVAAATAGKNHGKLLAAIARFSSQDGISILPEEFDHNPELLNLPNGTLNLHTHELLPHDQSDLITLTFGAELDKDAECPLFEAFMADSIPDVSVREYVQRCLGYSMLGKPVERTMFLLHGPSGTGKSVLTNVMTEVFGGYGTTAPASTFRLKNNESSIDVHKLRGRRFVATSEMPEGAQLDEELVKRITGGDTMTSRSLYEEFQDWRAQCVVWIATNFLPKVNSDDNAIWRRAKTVRMDTEYGSDGRPEIKGYADVLLLERNGILNWLLAGLTAYQQRGLDEPSAVTQDIENYRIEVDTVASFVRDLVDDGHLISDTEGEVKFSDLFRMYSEYSAANNIRLLGSRRFANRLKALGFSTTKVGGQAVWRGLSRNLEHGVLGTIF
jgi:putative DNA primase/helicase